MTSNIVRAVALAALLCLAVPLLLKSTAAPVAGAYLQPRLEAVDARFEQGNRWPAASLITFTVRFNSQVLISRWQWTDAAGKPINWQNATLPMVDMRPLLGVANAWVGRAAAPPLPGTYGVRVSAQPAGSTPGSAAPEQILTPRLRGTALADDKPFTRGIAFVRDRNIWLRSMDLKRERALTYLTYPAWAFMPAWASDGRSVVYLIDTGMSSVAGPSEVWSARPDGTGARRIAASPDRALAYPIFGPDGTLYVSRSRALQVGGVQLGETWDLHRVDTATGKFTLLQTGTSMASMAQAHGRLVFIRDTATSDGTVESSIVVSDLDGSNEQTLVASSVMDGLYMPSWSPDGRSILFVSRGKVAAGNTTKAPGLSAPLAHGEGVWDLWTIPASGGTPTLLSPAKEDLPYPLWDPNGKRVIYISPAGMWEVPAAGGLPHLLAQNDSHFEMSIFAPVPRPAQALPGASRCFKETGQCLRGAFLRYWDEHGGLMQMGFPITPELVEEGRTVQYTQRARLEMHPENAGTPSEVLVGRLGADAADSRAALGEGPFQRKPQPAGSSALYFPETGHTLQSPLRAYWEQNGGLPIFGYPMSEAFTEKSPTDGKTYLVQYFERNRLEYHPENAGTPNEVLLGLLGVQEYDRRYTP